MDNRLTDSQQEAYLQRSEEQPLLTSTPDNSAIAPAPHVKRGRLSWIGVIISLIIVAASVFVIWRLTKEISISELKAAFSSADLWTLAFAGLLTCISYLFLTGYDALALRQVRLRIPYRITALASFSSYAVSFNLGFPLVTGGAVRYWIYAARGISAFQVASLTVIAGITFWLGMGAILGWSLLSQGDEVAFLFSMRLSLVYLAGFTAIALIVGYFAFIAKNKRVVRLQGWHLELPGWKLSLGQMCLGVGDICAAAGVLFLLLPAGHGVSYDSFLALYVAAAMLGIAAHTPGGLGVFEATILLALSHLPTERVLGALLLFRLIYYFVPFIFALAMLGAYEVSGRIKALALVFRSGRRL